MNRIVHFEIHADDVERAAKFYRGIFNWEIGKWAGGNMDYWFVMTAPKDSKEHGINGGLIKRPNPLTDKLCGANAFVCTIAVDDYEKYAEKILSAGGRVAMPKFAIPGMAWQGYFIDTEGNTFGLHQADVKAA